MGLTDAMIATDLAAVFSDMSDSAVVEADVTITAKGLDGEARGTVDIFRGKKLTQEELKDSGWAQDYSFSVYIIQSEDPGILKGDKIELSEGTFRILNLELGPATAYLRLDLGAEY